MKRAGIKNSRFTAEQIIGFVTQVEAGMTVPKVARPHGFSPESLYECRAKYISMDAAGARRMKELEAKNNQLKCLLAEPHLEIEAHKVDFGVKR